MRAPKSYKSLVLWLGLLVFTALALWAYFQPGFVMDLANKYVFC